jgi:hypothetical protein
MRRRLLAVLGFLGLGVALAMCASSDETQGEDAILEGRIWLDRVPDQRGDDVQIAVFVAGGEDAKDWRGTVALAKGNAFRGDFERFRYHLPGGGKMRLQPLPSGGVSSPTFKARTCSEEGFDFCLDVEGFPRGPKRYRSKHGWEVEPGSPPDAAAALVRVAEGAEPNGPAPSGPSD